MRSPYVSVFSPNAEKYEPEETPYLDTFHAVYFFIIIIFIIYLRLFLFRYFPFLLVFQSSQHLINHMLHNINTA